MPNSEQLSSEKTTRRHRRTAPVPPVITQNTKRTHFGNPNRNKTNHFTPRKTNPLIVRLALSLPEVLVYRPTIPCNLETRGTRGSR
jgi:hypothetical protein